MENFIDTDINDPIKKRSKKKWRKSSRSTLRSNATYRSLKTQKILRKLVKEFLAFRVSAAGVSYVVNAKSVARRYLWLFAVVFSATFMGYMTFNVVKEYLGYPKSLIREGSIETKLSFPAVTFCNLNPIMNHNIKETSVAKLLKVKQMLQEATHVKTDVNYQDKCYDDPLCQWSWFSETCKCVVSPCLTEFCLMFNSTHCSCSYNFCRAKRFKSCRPDYSLSQRKPACYCSNDSIYITMPNKTNPEEFDILNSLNDSEVRHIIELIRKSETYDLADVDEAMLPTPDDMVEYGVNFDSLIISCSFEGSRCNRENFTVLYHPKYGKCYMFNFVGDRTSKLEKPLDIYSYGSSSGLQLILHVSEEQAVDLLNRELGVRVVVHDPRDLPFVAEYGINIRPMDMSAIEVTFASIERLGPPWGSCIKEGTTMDYGGMSGPYSILGCEKKCRHLHLKKGCNCTKRQFIRGSVFLKTSTKVDFCNFANSTQYACMEKVINNIEKGKVCNCPPPCKETRYSYTVSSSLLNENYFRAIKAIRTLVNNDNGGHNITNATREKAMVGVKVYYSTFEVDRDSEVASYSWETLVANIGGNLGFFMGLTLVTFVEVIEFLWDFICTSIRRRTSESDHKINKIYTYTKAA
ncbi:amiloride-sensitive sodium channel subunit beta-like [Argiope bruennichi]|uniref:amiloride-sensitive sodium channel subunit beta-like n=1 Tax=Argiope bruennichi TaxID=94029 RepID=UPI00249417EA|nr:amiloride-sensitive sodium channel subunit beta-like [Argiope bruennichi]